MHAKEQILASHCSVYCNDCATLQKPGEQGPGVRVASFTNRKFIPVTKGIVLSTDSISHWK